MCYISLGMHVSKVSPRGKHSYTKHKNSFFFWSHIPVNFSTVTITVTQTLPYYSFYIFATVTQFTVPNCIGHSISYSASIYMYRQTKKANNFKPWFVLVKPCLVYLHGPFPSGYLAEYRKCI